MLGNLTGKNIAIALGSETIWLAVGSDGPVIATPSYVACINDKVIVVGEEARRMRGNEHDNIQVHRITRHGGFSDVHRAEAVMRYLFRRHKCVGGFAMAPRAVIVTEESLKVKSVVIHAGAREVLALKSVMAAAIGSGMAVEEPEMKAVFILERDWCAFGLISLAGLLVHFALHWGVDLLLEDFALHTLATRSVALDLDALHDTFLVRGLSGAGNMLGWDAWLGELETGRATVVSADEADFRRGSQPFALRLSWHYRRAMEAADKSKRRDSSAAPLHLFGPYTKIPGVADLMAKVFQRGVVIPQNPEEAMVRGGQKVLVDLPFLLPHLKGRKNG